MTRSVLYLAYFFPPRGGAAVQRSLKFAKYLPEFGWRPLVVANGGAIDAVADALSGSAGISVAVSGVAGAVAKSTATAAASAIDAGDGADRIANTGVLTSDAKALAGTLTVGVTTAGVAVAGDSVWDGGTPAIATAKTIAAGDGADVVTNDGDVSAVSTAGTASAAVTVAVSGVGASAARSTPRGVRRRC